MTGSRHALPYFSWALRPYRLQFLLGIASSVINKVLDLMPPILVAWVIDTIQGAPPTWIHYLIPQASAWKIAIVLSGLGFIIFLFEIILNNSKYQTHF